MTLREHSGKADSGGGAYGVQETASGKYLTFFLDDEEYGLEILKVQEIMGIMDITPVPRTPDFMKGVVNLRGKIIPVIDLRLKFGMDELEYAQETCIIVVEVYTEHMPVTMGVIVDRVSEVLDIDSENIDETPEFGVSLDTDFIVGIGKIADKVVIILDADSVLTEKEKIIAGKIVTSKGEYV